MRKKLTLTIDESLIKKAKSYSKDNGTSLSQLIENYLITLIEGDTHRIQLSSKLKKKWVELNFQIILTRRKN